MAESCTQAIVLAAGRSRRFKTTANKLIHSLCGKPMIWYPLSILQQLSIPTTLVVGHQAEQVIHAAHAADFYSFESIFQDNQVGTGEALRVTKSCWNREIILVLNGDMPLITAELIQQAIDYHIASRATATICATYVTDPRGYGRIIVTPAGPTVVEERDCTDDQRLITRINPGIYLFSKTFLEKTIETLQPSPTTGEFYLPDLVNAAVAQKLAVALLDVPFDSVRGVNTLEELWEAEQIKRAKIIKSFMLQGVRFDMPHTTHVDIDCSIAADSRIGAGALLLGKTTIGNGCTIGAYAIIENSTIKRGTQVYPHSVIQESIIGAQVAVGPFARLRNNVVLGDSSVVGNFVEIKNSTLGQNSKAKHLSYLGDATIGAEVNIGAGTITCNHDGVKKNPTIIEDQAYIGTNNALVAPIVVGRGAYTAAGSTITKNVEPDALAIARAQQVNKEGYAKKIRAAKTQEPVTDEQNSEHFVGAVIAHAKNNSDDHNENL